MPRVKRLGLTGSIGSGKSTVARLLSERGVAVLD
ncbi:MAG TPA: dephospho-CoA kinase, partial [Deinococcales bacterium]|nr:dephospho-CoA kinase [Deinococcales bacterium]